MVLPHPQQWKAASPGGAQRCTRRRPAADRLELIVQLVRVVHLEQVGERYGSGAAMAKRVGEAAMTTAAVAGLSGGAGGEDGRHERDREQGGAQAEQLTWGWVAKQMFGVGSSLLGLAPGPSRSRRRPLTPGPREPPVALTGAALSLPEQGLSALPGLCGPVRPWQSTQAAPRPLCWMGSMVWAASRGRRRPVRRAGACSGVTAGLAQPSRAALRISGNRSGRLTGTSIGCLG